MNIHASVIQPVDEQLCRDCRFCMHLIGDDLMAGVLVCCRRRDCDNTHPERLAPLLSPPPSSIQAIPRTPGLFSRLVSKVLNTVRDTLFVPDRKAPADAEPESGAWPGYAAR